MATLTEGERITRLETEINHVATKADVTAVRTDIEAVRTDIANLHTTLVMWMAGAAAGIVLSIGLGVADLIVGVLGS